MLRKWEDLPEFMQTPEVRPYWEILNKKRGQLALKRAFDVTAGLALLVLLCPPMAVIAIMMTKARAPPSTDNIAHWNLSLQFHLALSTNRSRFRIYLAIEMSVADGDSSVICFNIAFPSKKIPISYLLGISPAIRGVNDVKNQATPYIIAYFINKIKSTRLCETRYKEPPASAGVFFTDSCPKYPGVRPGCSYRFGIGRRPPRSLG